MTSKSIVLTRNPLSALRPRAVLILAVAAVACCLLNVALPQVSALTTAVLAGAVLRNAGLIAPRVLGDIAAATKVLLRAGVMLLGLQLSLGQVLRLDPSLLVVLVVTVAVTFGLTCLLGRLIKVRPGTTLLVATGFSICGASAAAAMDAVSDSDEEDLATTVGLVTIFGGIGMFALPALGVLLHLQAHQIGAWAGASVQEVAQVVAAATVAGPGALAIATAVKLTRVVLLAPLIAGYGVLRRRSGKYTAATRPPLIPLFVVGFLAMIALRSTDVLAPEVLSATSMVTTGLLAAALFGLGTSVHLVSLVRTGARPLLLGAVSTVCAAAVALLGVLVVG